MAPMGGPYDSPGRLKLQDITAKKFSCKTWSKDLELFLCFSQSICSLPASIYKFKDALNHQLVGILIQEDT